MAEVEETQVTRATWRMGKLKAAGVELHEILGGRAGAALIRDYCGGDHEVAYAAIAFAYFPTTSKIAVSKTAQSDAGCNNML